MSKASSLLSVGRELTESELTAVAYIRGSAGFHFVSESQRATALFNTWYPGNILTP